MRRRRLLATAIAALALGLGFLAIPAPAFEEDLSGALLDREGHLLSATIATDEQWRLPAGATIPERYITALTTFEDRRFFWHPGVDPLAILRALRTNLAAGHVVSGASTLTMQVVRLSRNNPPRTLPEKALEAVLALRLEAARSKREILELYAAHAPMGGNTVGLEAAAWRYFDHDPAELSWAEAATLAVLPNSPGLIHPGRGRAQLLAKRDRLIDALTANGVLDALDARLAKAEPLPDTPGPVPSLAPHLVAHVAGQRVQSTLDAQQQRQVVEILRRHQARLSGNGIHNLAALVIEIESGAVSAYVGNAAPLSDPEQAGHVDLVPARRSTGSTLKPFLYAGMLEDGQLLPEQLVPDLPMRLGGFSPENYDKEYEGAVPANAALARSRNVPAVWMLRAYGVERFYGLLGRLGMRSLFRPASDYGLALILGGAEGSLWDLVGMYRQLARSARGWGPGDPISWTPLPAAAPSGEPPLFEPGAAWFTLQAMEEVNRPGVHAGWRTYDSARRVAWKTGTSYGFRDAWAIGITPTHIIGVWAGNADGEGRPGLTGFEAAAPVLFDLVDLTPREPWYPEPAAALVQVEICDHSGMRAGPDCADHHTAFVPKGARRATACTYCERIHCDAGCAHRVDASCSEIAEIESPSWFVLPPGQEWFYEKKHADYQRLPPVRADCREGAAEAQPMSLVSPREGAEVYVPIDLSGQRGAVVFEAAHRDPEATIHWHLDADYLTTTTLVHQVELAPSAGEHKLTLVDGDGHVLERRFVVVDRE